MTDPRIAKAKARLDESYSLTLLLDRGGFCFADPLSGNQVAVITQALNSHAAALELAEVMTGCRRGVDFCRVCLGDEGPDGWPIHGTDCPVGKFLDTLGEQE